MVCFDFITELKRDVVVVRLCTGLRDSASVYYQPSVLPPVNTSGQSHAVLGMHQPIERSVLSALCVVMQERQGTECCCQVF